MIVRAALVVVLLVLTGSVKAEVKQYNLEIGDYMGGYLFLSETEDIGHSGVAGLRVGYNFPYRIGVEAALGWVPFQGGSIVQMHFDVLYHFVNSNYVPYASVCGGFSKTLADEGSAPDMSPLLGLGVGIKVYTRDWVSLRLDVHYVNTGIESEGGPYHHLQITAGLSFNFLGDRPDEDGDGVPDLLDRCPTALEDRDGFEDGDGCPDLDNDEDGIPDSQDRCPLDVEDRDGFQDDDGCPDLDNDQDGVPDNSDRCPNVPEDRDGYEDFDGCPDLDDDQDGVRDPDDRCPRQPEDRDGFEDGDGCPDPDNDQDGILDENDKCPNEPEDMDGDRDTDGCPDPPPAGQPTTSKPTTSRPAASRPTTSRPTTSNW